MANNLPRGRLFGAGTCAQHIHVYLDIYVRHKYKVWGKFKMPIVNNPHLLLRFHLLLKIKMHLFTFSIHILKIYHSEFSPHMYMFPYRIQWYCADVTNLWLKLCGIKSIDFQSCLVKLWDVWASIITLMQQTESLWSIH